MRHRWFVAACIVLILMGLAHLAADLAPQPEPKPGDEATMVSLVKSVKLELPGGRRTMMEILKGFGMFFTLAAATMGVVGLRMVRQPGARRIAEVYAVALAAMLINSIVHWFIIPTSFLALALALTVVSLIPKPAPSAAS